ncbi:NAD(P)-dependent alcohol dehydrogenase, partial [Mangrovimicrobium sediminis]
QCPCCARGAPAYCEQFFPLNFVGGRSDGSSGLSHDGAPVLSHFFGQSSFASHSLCAASALVRVPADFPLELAGPFGCGFQTGAGAVLNSLQVRPGSSVAVLGAGAVGLAAVCAAKHIAGATTVIAVDVQAGRLDVARELGASHALDAGGDIETALRAICPRGVDYAIDTTGRIAVAEQWVGLLAAQGTLGLLASYGATDTLGVNAIGLMTAGKRIQGVMEGDSDIQTFIPQLMAHYQAGRFPVDRLVSYYDFEDINAAIAAAEGGTAIKAVLRMA